MTDRELAGCACPMCGAPVTVERRAMFSGNEEAMASGIPDDYVERYTYRRAPSSDAVRYRRWRLLAASGTMSDAVCEMMIAARTEADIDAAIDAAIAAAA